MVRLDAANSYADRGWHVHPLQPGSKEPATRWRDTATTDRTTLQQWFGSGVAGIGIACGDVSGIVVVDVDDLAAIPKLREQGPLPDTLTARTPRGGLHLYYQHPGFEVRNSAGLLAEGVDVRGDGGYVVAPPTVLPNGSYTWVSHRPLAPLPEWVGKARTREPSAPAPAVQVDPSGTSRWGATVLEREIARLVGAPEGQRNSALYQSALKTFGAVKAGHVDQGQAEAQFVATAVRIGLERGEAERTVASAWEASRERGPQELPAPAAVATGVPAAKPDENTSDDGGWLSFDQILGLPPVTWLVPGQIPVGLNMLYGQYGSGKSFTAIDWALTLACGLTGEGKKTVAFCVGEGLEGFGARVQTWLEHHGQTIEPGRFIARSGRKFPRLLEPDSVAELCSDIETLPEPPDLLIIDTLARSLSSEEGPREFGQAVKVCDDIRNRYGTSSLLVHHAGVNPDRERGATNLGAACDSIWRLEAPEEGVNRYHRLVNTKQKGGKEHHGFERQLNSMGSSALMMRTCADDFRGTSW